MAAAAATLLRSAMSSLAIEAGTSLKVRNESRNSCHFHPMTDGSDAVFNKGKFALDLGKFISKASVVVIVAAISFDLGNSIPVVEV